MTADVQRELAEALRADVLNVTAEGWAERVAAALLPTVQALITDAEKRAAAGALREAADALRGIAARIATLEPRVRVQRQAQAFDARADALDPT